MLINDYRLTQCDSILLINDQPAAERRRRHGDHRTRPGRGDRGRHAHQPRGRRARRAHDRAAIRSRRSLRARPTRRRCTCSGTAACRRPPRRTSCITGSRPGAGSRAATITLLSAAADRRLPLMDALRMAVDTLQLDAAPGGGARPRGEPGGRHRHRRPRADDRREPTSACATAGRRSLRTRGSGTPRTTCTCCADTPAKTRWCGRWRPTSSP